MLSNAIEVSLSKFMTKLLRHTPEQYGLILDLEDGSCTLDDLLSVLVKAPRWAEVTVGDIQQVVAGCEKQRFEVNGDRIKARYGHSHTKISYDPGTPPSTLYHGTHAGVLSVILEEGLQSMGRQYVHLSEGTHFASLAGSRRGKLNLLTVDTISAGQMGVTFYCAGNEVWLADPIPASCLNVYTPL
ncbi:RNA 2'-phosphotransferase [Paenibacillus sp. B2(2019)]|uniref:RNA 2'-phosphotransferase n=1 Tax=Paenibacillus sp. B2(2019) TaxID=2607754 RepID=UPI0011F0A24C|nr:RNA 2'-phosphotransferase [Paenibacillus sp. B2(2019)]KAA1183320.1 RNA 2'-phosphotransferase [Paenibacillus sp. B2(2019)]